MLSRGTKENLSKLSSCSSKNSVVTMAFFSMQCRYNGLLFHAAMTFKVVTKLIKLGHINELSARMEQDISLFPMKNCALPQSSIRDIKLCIQYG